MMCNVPHRFFDRTWFMASALFLFALAVRALLLYFEPQMSRDSMYYYFQAIGADLEDFPEYGAQAPLFPGILRAFHLCGISPICGGLALNLIVGALIPLLLARLARDLKIKTFWCWFAGFLAAVHPQLVQASIRLERETPYVFFSVLMLLALVRGCVAGKAAGAWLAGCAGAAAAVTRFEGWEALPLIPLLLIATRSYGAGGWKRSLCAAAYFVCGWFLSLAVLLCMLGFPVFHYFSLMRSYAVKFCRFVGS